MKYIMVTHWDRHWDNLTDSRTKFTESMFRNGMDKTKLINATETTFIKKHTITRSVEKCWEGRVYDFQTGIYRNLPAVYFRVEIDKEILCPVEYRDLAEGWYLEETTVNPQKNISSVDNVITEEHIKKITIKDVFQILGQLSLGAFSLIFGVLIGLLIIAYRFGYWVGVHR